MHITALQLEDYRNYGRLEIEPGPGLNVLVGRNAQGKSNLLESVYVLATTKSARAGKDQELIRFGTGLARVTASITRERTPDIDLQLQLSQTEKKAMRLNGVRHTKLAEVIGQFNAVLFESGDLEIIRGEPSIRRRFLDLEIAQTSPRYVHAMAAYRKTLEQRNRLLKDLRDHRAGRDGYSALPVWNAQLATYGARLMDRRRQFLERLGTIAAEIHILLSDGRDSLRLVYAPSFALDELTNEEEVRERFIDILGSAESDELNRGSTLFGPQRDDVVFTVNDQDCRLFGSQGQQRTVALSLKLAERQLIEELVGEPPALLLDDVLSDLDDVRRRLLFEITARSGSQTFLSCTNLRAFPAAVLEQAMVYDVTSGEVTRNEFRV